MCQAVARDEPVETARGLAAGVHLYDGTVVACGWHQEATEEVTPLSGSSGRTDADNDSSAQVSRPATYLTLR